MLSFAPDYDNLPLIAKVEVFEYALQNTEGNDLSRVLWLKSRTSEVWLDRRTNYTRSLAVMSMVCVPCIILEPLLKLIICSGLDKNNVP